MCDSLFLPFLFPISFASSLLFVSQRNSPPSTAQHPSEKVRTSLQQRRTSSSPVKRRSFFFWSRGRGPTSTTLRLFPSLLLKEIWLQKHAFLSSPLFGQSSLPSLPRQKPIEPSPSHRTVAGYFDDNLRLSRSFFFFDGTPDRLPSLFSVLCAQAVCAAYRILLSPYDGQFSPSTEQQNPSLWLQTSPPLCQSRRFVEFSALKSPKYPFSLRTFPQ